MSKELTKIQKKYLMDRACKQSDRSMLGVVAGGLMCLTGIGAPIGLGMIIGGIIANEDAEKKKDIINQND